MFKYILYFGEIIVIAMFIFVLALADTARAESRCLSGDKTIGAEFGTAKFVGEPWQHKWSTQSMTTVPGQDLEIQLQNGSNVRWRNGNQEPGAWADNLSTLQRSLGDGPFTAVRLRDGSITVINDNCEQSWTLVENKPTTPVATDGTVVNAREYECLATSGILTFERIKTDENGLPYDDPVRQTGGFYLTFGPGQYVVGVDTWGDQSYFRIDDDVCGSSS